MDAYEIYLPRGYFIQLAGFSDDDFRIFTKTHSIKTDDKGYYPVFEVMSRLNIVRRKGKWGTGDADAALKMARIKQITLMTNIKSKNFIEIAIAKSRIKSILLATANKIRYAIKSTSPRLLMISNAYDAETILTDGYNSAIESLLYEADSLKSWEQYGLDNIEDGSELAEDSETDISTGNSEETPPIDEGQHIGENRPVIDAVPD